MHLFASLVAAYLVGEHLNAITVWGVYKCTYAYKQIKTCKHTLLTDICTHTHTHTHTQILTHWQYTCTQTHAWRISTANKQITLGMTTQHSLTLKIHLYSSSNPFDDLGVLGEVVELAPNFYLEDCNATTTTRIKTGVIHNAKHHTSKIVLAHKWAQKLGLGCSWSGG